MPEIAPESTCAVPEFWHILASLHPCYCQFIYYNKAPQAHGCSHLGVPGRQHSNSKGSWDHLINISKGPNTVTLSESLWLLRFDAVYIKFTCGFCKRYPGLDRTCSSTNWHRKWSTGCISAEMYCVLGPVPFNLNASQDLFLTILIFSCS